MNVLAWIIWMNISSFPTDVFIFSLLWYDLTLIWPGYLSRFYLSSAHNIPFIPFNMSNFVLLVLLVSGRLTESLHVIRCYVWDVVSNKSVSMSKCFPQNKWSRPYLKDKVQNYYFSHDSEYFLFTLKYIFILKWSGDRYGHNPTAQTNWQILFHSPTCGSFVFRDRLPI